MLVASEIKGCLERCMVEYPSSETESNADARLLPACQVNPLGMSPSDAALTVQGSFRAAKGE